MKAIKQSIVLFLCLLVVACTGDTIRKLATAADDIAIGVGVAIDAKRAIHEHGLITDQEELVITKALFDVNSAAIQFSRNVRAISKIDGPTKTQLLELFRQLNQAVEAMNNSIKSISNPEAQAKIRLATGVIDVGILAIQTILGGL